MSPYLKNIIAAVLIALSNFSLANDSAFIKLDFAPSLNLDKFEVIVNDGVNRFSFKPKERNYWSGQLYAPFAYLEVMYVNSDSTYFLSNAFLRQKIATLTS